MRLSHHAPRSTPTRNLMILLLSLLLMPAAAVAGSTNLQGGTWGQHILTSSNDWGICSSCSSSSYYKTGIASPSLSGKATEFHIGGTISYMDVLWNQSIVRYATLNGKDVVTNTHHFIYDAYFYVKSLGYMQGIEFDINQFLNGRQYTWGHECRGNISGNEWDVWEASGTTAGKGTWRPTGIPCYPKGSAWNHIRLTVERTSTNTLHYISIELNGKTSYVNKYYKSGPANPDWHAITLNFQLDGDSSMHGYSAWVDQMALYYWF